jgi:hypothetical protein
MPRKCNKFLKINTYTYFIHLFNTKLYTAVCYCKIYLKSRRCSQRPPLRSNALLITIHPTLHTCRRVASEIAIRENLISRLSCSDVAAFLAYAPQSKRMEVLRERIGVDILHFHYVHVSEIVHNPSHCCGNAAVLHTAESNTLIYLFIE